MLSFFFSIQCAKSSHNMAAGLHLCYSFWLSENVLIVEYPLILLYLANQDCNCQVQGRLSLRRSAINCDCHGMSSSWWFWSQDMAMCFAVTADICVWFVMTDTTVALLCKQRIGAVPPMSQEQRCQLCLQGLTPCIDTCHKLPSGMFEYQLSQLSHQCKVTLQHSAVLSPHMHEILVLLMKCNTD